MLPLSKGSGEAHWVYRSGDPASACAATSQPGGGTIAHAMHWVSLPFQLMLVIGLVPFSTARTRRPVVPPAE